jgi:hypothetical protein
VKIIVVQFLLFITPERENEVLGLTPCQLYYKTEFLYIKADTPEILTNWKLKHLRDIFEKDF